MSFLAGRTIAVGDVHGELGHLVRLWQALPELDAEDTVVFLGDYLDRGPDSKGVMDFLRSLPQMTPAKLVFLRGNHEDGWMRAIEQGFLEFLLPQPNGCLACLRSFVPNPAGEEMMSAEEIQAMSRGTFFPAEVVEWMRVLPHWYEDEHAIYVHAGLPKKEDRFLHPSEVEDPLVLLWLRSTDFFRNYRGKRVICGHTATEDLPVELSTYTPEDQSDLWFRGEVVAIDTKCGKPNGFLTAIELPSLQVYESR